MYVFIFVGFEAHWTPKAELNWTPVDVNQSTTLYKDEHQVTGQISSHLKVFYL